MLDPKPGVLHCARPKYVLNLVQLTRWVQVEDGLLIQVLLRHHRLDHVLHELLVDGLVGHIRAVLGGDQDGVHAHRHHSPSLLFVLHGHLSRVPDI